MKNFTNEKYGIRLAAPEGWTSTPNPSLLFLLIAPETPGETFRTNFNMIGEGGGDAGLNLIHMKTIMTLRNQLPGFELISESTLPEDYYMGKKILYRYQLQNLTIQAAYWLVLFEGNVYHLTGSSLAAQFDLYQADFDKIAGRLEFL
jgi:hypothetical protein